MAYLPSVVVLHLPAPGKLQLLIGEHVEEGDEVAVVLVALEEVSVSTHLADHVLQAGVARKHAIGTLRGGHQEATREPMRETRVGLFQWYDAIFLFYLRHTVIQGFSYMISAVSVHQV